MAGLIHTADTDGKNQTPVSAVAPLPVALYAADGSGALGATTDAIPVKGSLKTVSVTPTVEATPDYSTGDVIGGKSTIAAIASADGATGYITAVRISSKAAITVPIDVFFFRADPSNSTFTENGAVAINAADLTNILGVVQVSTWFSGGTPSVGYAECRIPVTGLIADDIYVVMVARGTINLASTSDLIVEVTQDQN